MKFVIILAIVIVVMLLNSIDDRLLYVENYLRQILDLMHEIKSKQNE